MPCAAVVIINFQKVTMLTFSLEERNSKSSTNIGSCATRAFQHNLKYSLTTEHVFERVRRCVGALIFHTWYGSYSCDSNACATGHRRLRTWSWRSWVAPWRLAEPSFALMRLAPSTAPSSWERPLRRSHCERPLLQQTSISFWQCHHIIRVDSCRHYCCRGS